eukprot:3838331-Ditylum_brightwellii.AAC.1
MGTGVGSCVRYKFSHDQIQKAAYSITPEADRPSMHLHIGRMFLNDAENRSTVDENIFLIVDQLNYGKSLINQAKERISLARLNLIAGERSIQSSAFVPALTYLKTGLSMLKS